MKRLAIIFILLGYLIPLNAQIDRTSPPEPGPPPVIQIGDYQTFTLDNGLRVILVENNKIPVVSFQLTLDIDPVMEYDAKGYVSMAGSLMRSGTTNRDKTEIDEEIDFLGASLSTYSTGMFASSLSRHTDKLLDLMADVLLNPTFPEDELEKNITQTITGLSTTRTDANAMASNISTVLVYGPDHPYGEVTTEESVSNIKRELLVDYYNTYFKPNKAYMVIVGDISKERARILMENYFSAWQPGDVPSHTYETPMPPDFNTVAVADRVGAVQSVVLVTYPIIMQPGHEDALEASVMNSILGGGVFSGRLMQNLREEKGYTYGIRSGLTPDRLVGRFNIRTEVRNSVTDSTINEILYEMERMVNEPVDQENLELVKNFMNGSFARSLESPRTIANFALNIERYNLPKDYYATYLERLDQVSIEDVRKMAEKYIKPGNSYIIVAGNKSEIAGSLEKFSEDGEIAFYDPFGRRIEIEPVKVADEAADEVTNEITAEKVIENYIIAIGGDARLRNIMDITYIMTMQAQGMILDMELIHKAPDKFKSTVSIGNQPYQVQVYDGIKGINASGRGVTELEGEMLENLKNQAIIFPELTYVERGYKMELDGIENVEGQNAYKVILTSLRNNRTIEYFNVGTGLKVRTINPPDEAGGMTIMTDYRDYQLINGIKFPFLIRMQTGPQAFDLRVSSILMNTGIDDEPFRIN
jgi:zinc protease